MYSCHFLFCCIHSEFVSDRHICSSMYGRKVVSVHNSSVGISTYEYTAFPNARRLPLLSSSFLLFDTTTTNTDGPPAAPSPLLLLLLFFLDSRVSPTFVSRTQPRSTVPIALVATRPANIINMPAGKTRPFFHEQVCNSVFYLLYILVRWCRV